MGWLRRLRRGVTWVTLGAAGGAAYVTARHLLQTPQPLESALPGEVRIDRRHGGDIFYNVAGAADAAPLVLLHDFYPGASNFEFRNIFARLARNARVYAPDWLGFGMSEHPHVAYTGEFYAGVLGGFLRDTVQRPAAVLAFGLAGNVAVRAASDTPDLFDRLILVSPEVTAGEGPEPTVGQAVVRTAQRMSLGLVPYALVSTHPALRWIANRRSATTGADEEQVDHLFASAHQFGGQHALLALLTGELDLPMRNALQTLQSPVLIVVGADDPKRSRDAMEEVAVLNPRADLEVVPDAGSAVFEDQPAAFIDAVEAWIGVPKPRNVARPTVRNASAYLGPAQGDEEPYSSLLLPPMDDMGAPVPEFAPTDEETGRPLDEETAAAYTPDDMGAGEVRGVAWLAGTSLENAPGATGPVRALADSAADSGAMGRQAAAMAERAATSASTADQPAAASADQPAAASADDHVPPFEEQVGGAGFVTPGVSDMGIEGPNTDTINSGTVLAEEAAGASGEAGARAATAGDASPSDLIPEAGDVARPSNRDELEAREGLSPPLDAGANIADLSLVGSPEGADEGVDEGPAAKSGAAAGRRGIPAAPEVAAGTPSVATTDSAVDTTDTAVATPEAAVATGDGAVVTPERAVGTEDGELPTRPVRAVRRDGQSQEDVAPASEDAPEAQPEPAARRPARDRAESATRPLISRERPSQSTSAASRQTGARTMREGGTAKGGSAGSGSRRDTGSGKGAGAGKGGSRSGHKHKK